MREPFGTESADVGDRPGHDFEATSIDSLFSWMEEPCNCGNVYSHQDGGDAACSYCSGAMKLRSVFENLEKEIKDNNTEIDDLCDDLRKKTTEVRRAYIAGYSEARDHATEIHTIADAAEAFREWQIAVSGSQEQPRTMCKTHGWWDIGPCPYCTNATGIHEEDCDIHDYVPRPCSCGVELVSGRQTPAFQIERSHEAVDAFWKVWMEVGEPHKHGVYESTWMSLKAAMKAGGKDQRTNLAMSEMIEKASDAIRQTACPKCSQRGLIECEHINPTDLAEKINSADGRESSNG